MTEWTADKWRGKKVTVAGLGTFGGQVAAAKFFAQMGAKVTVTDKKAREALEVSLAELAGLDIRYVLGGHEEKDFTHADLIVASPAIPESSPYLVAAGKAGVAITHEMDIFFQMCKAPIFGVTGSNGKSTTTALLAHILSRHFGAAGGGRQVRLGGNIGRSLLLEIDRIEARDIVVLELSSFQLEDLGALGLSPHGAVVTNLSPNHLDRHVTFENYARAKRNITLFQSEGDFLVLNADDANLAGWEETRARVLYFGSLREGSRDGVYVSGRSLVCVADGKRKTAPVPRGWKLMGVHNLANLAAATAAACEAGADFQRSVAEAEDFQPLPHRIEYVATIRGVMFYNDSIATTPESVEVAFDSFQAPLILIAGGYDKGVDLAPFAARAARRVKALVAIGKTAERIVEAALRERADLTVIRPKGFIEAIDKAFEAAEPGDVVLMSPACASFDMFNNFEQRGDMFRQHVLELAAKAEAGEE